MFSWIAGGVMALALFDGPKEDLVALGAKFSSVESYRFTSTLVTEGGGFGGREEGAAAPEPVTGQYKPRAPMHLMLGTTEAFKDGDTLVYKEGAGEWKIFEPASMRGGRGRGAGRSLFGLSRQDPPHELFAELALKLADEVERVEVPAVEGEAPQPAKTVYKGALTKAGAEAFGGRGGFGRGGRGGGDVQLSGDYTIEVEGGRIVRARFEITRSGTFGEREFELKSVQTLAFEGFGEVQYDVPEEALVLFEV